MAMTVHESLVPPRERVGAVIAAAGMSRRMAGVDKLMLALDGRPILDITVTQIHASPEIHEIVLVVRADMVEAWTERARAHGWAKVKAVVAGGARRQDSVLAGLHALGPCTWVVVHDGARPCVTDAMVSRGLEAVRETGAAVAAVLAKDTVKLVGEGLLVEGTPPRERVWLVQTPQIFAYDIILKAYEILDQDVTDDASAVEMAGHKVRVFMGAYNNIKVTTPEDIDLLRPLLRALYGPSALDESVSGSGR